MKAIDIKKAVIAAVESVTVPKNYVTISYSVSKFREFEEVSVYFHIDEDGPLKRYTFMFGSHLSSYYSDDDYLYMSNEELYEKLKEEFLKVGVTL